MDNRVLLGNYLSLPHQNDGHDAHRKDANGQNNSGLRFRGGNMKHASNPFHK